MLRHVFSEAARPLVAAATAAPVRGLLVAVTPVVSTAPIAAAAASLRLLLGTVSVVATPVAPAASTIACCQPDICSDTGGSRDLVAVIDKPLQPTGSFLTLGWLLLDTKATSLASTGVPVS